MRKPAVLLALGALVAAATAAAQSGPSKIERAVTAPRPVVSAPLPVGVEADVYCAGWLGQEAEPFPGSIVSAEKVDNQRSFLQGDVVYLDIGAENGVAAGQEFWVVRPERLVYEPASATDLVGRVYETPARVRVLCAQERSAIAEIQLSCSDVIVGDRVLPFEAIPIPLVRRTRPLTSCDPPTGKILGRVVELKDHITPASTGTVLYLDLGEADGLNPGDFLTVLRQRPASLAGYYPDYAGAAPTSARTVLGEVAVLTTREHTSVAIMTSMRDTVYVGDEVEPK